MINITKEKLTDILNKAFDEGMCGYQDLKQSFIEKLIEDYIKKSSGGSYEPFPSCLQYTSNMTTGNFYVSGGSAGYNMTIGGNNASYTYVVDDLRERELRQREIEWHQQPLPSFSSIQQI